MSFNAFPVPTISFDSLFFRSVKAYGATGNGSTDDSAAFASAFSDISNAGGGMLFVPPGTYNFATDTMSPPSNCVVQGAGIDATTILSTATASGKDCALTVLMTMTGSSSNWGGTNTTYPINAPTLGGTTVTTTTAGDAGNFAAGNIIMISGGLHATAFWYPSWYTTVVSAVAGTGVITLAETLPFGGSSVTTVQKILALPKNITVRDMTLSVNSNPGGGGVSGAIMNILGCETFLIENVKFVNVSGLTGAGIAIGAPARRSGYRNCHATPGSGPIELFGCTESFIEGCTCINSALLVDGGSMDCTVINNFIKDPQENSAAFHGIHCPDYDLRLRVIGNVITGLSGTFAGINCTGTPDMQRDNVIMGNTITGASGSTSGVNTENGVVIGNMFVNLTNGVNMDSTGNAFIDGNYFDTVTNQIVPFSGSGGWRNTQAPTLRSMPASTASPTVTGDGTYEIFQSGAFNVTGFTGGLPGDQITVLTGDANTTFVNSGSLQMKGAANYNPASNIVLSFLCLTTSSWIEKSRSA